MTHASQLGAARTALEEAQTCARLLADGKLPEELRDATKLRLEAALVATIGAARTVLADSRIGVNR